MEQIYKVWKDMQPSLVSEFGEETYQSWIAPLVPLRLEKEVLIFAVPSIFMRNWILTHYANFITQKWTESIPDIERIDFVIETHVAPIVSEDTKEIVQLEHRFSFDSFVVGKPNEFAFAAALRVSESKTPPFNPLFLYGGVGLGKTHLMHSIALRIHQLFPEKRVLYMTSEQFMHRFIQSVRHKTTELFKDEFRSVDVLMIDDIQFIAGKENTQEELFHTFNSIVDGNRQVIISADKSPTDLDRIEERLKSRLGWGLVADIHPTNFELRLSILQAKAEKMNCQISSDILEYLAMNVTSSVRELEGALNRIVAHTQMMHEQPSLSHVQDFLKDHVRHTGQTSGDIDKIQNFVCSYFGISLIDLLSVKRSKDIAHARQVAIYMTKIFTSKSLPEIGRCFGGRDHTTILHAIRKIQDQKDKNKKLAYDLIEIEKKLKIMYDGFFTN
jgi:chromosomal replication initiator protein